MPPKHTPQNGKYEAPHFLNGASSHSHPNRPTAPSQQRTVFPPDPNHADLRRPAYLLDQFLFFGAPLRRHLTFVLAALAAIAAFGVLPGRWWTAGALIVIVVGFTIYLRSRRNDNFVQFKAETAPDPIPERLHATDKIAVYVTGYFSVEGKYKHFTQLPGFYRTFASGEHALLCLIRDRTVYNVGHWPEEDIGMWYIFFMPELIQNIEWGELSFGPERSRAIAVTYLLTIPPNDQNLKERTVAETVYITTDGDEVARQILADLLWQLPPQAQPMRTQRPQAVE